MSSKNYDSIEPITEQKETCTSTSGYEWINGVYTLIELKNPPCGKVIETMAFKGTGVCGEEHRKAMAKNKKPLTG